MLPKNAQGQNVVQASSGSGKFLAGLGAMVSGGLAMSRRKVFEDELHERRKDLATHNATLDIVKRAMGYDLEQQHATDMIPVMESGGYRKVGQLVRQATITYEGQKPDTKGNEGTPGTKGAGNQDGQPTTEDSAPESSTSGMKPAKTKKPSVSGKAKRTRIKDVDAAVAGGHISPAEAAELNTTYAARIGRAKAGTKKTPSVKPPKPGKNGNSSSTNGNKRSK